MAKPDDKTLSNLHNDIVETVKEALCEVDQIHNERSALNDRKAEVRSMLKAKGVHKDAFDMALKYSGWDDDKRKGFDIAYQICREAIGSPFDPQQMDLFPDPEEEADEKQAA